MNTHRLLTPGLISGLLALAACGSSSISLSDLGDELNRRSCQGQVNCGAYPDLQTCLDAQSDPGGIDQLQVSVNAGRVKYDGDKAGECLDALTSQMTCESFVNYGESPTPEACNQVFTGTVAAGGECYDSAECADNGTCNLSCNTGECCAGTCVAGDPAPALANLGEDCSNTECNEGLWCKTDSTNNTSACAELGGEGAACSGFSGCGADLACDGLFGDGTCVRPAKPGETCDPQQGFGLLSCARDDNYCDTTDTTCKQKVAVGQACDTQQSNCVNYAYCDAGTCTERPVENEACVTDGPSCLGALECTNSVCTFPTPTPTCPAS